MDKPKHQAGCQTYALCIIIYILIGENLHISGDVESDWLFAQSLTTKREGYIPRSYVTSISSMQARE